MTPPHLRVQFCEFHHMQRCVWTVPHPGHGTVSNSSKHSRMLPLCSHSLASPASVDTGLCSVTVVGTFPEQCINGIVEHVISWDFSLGVMSLRVFWAVGSCTFTSVAASYSAVWAYQSLCAHSLAEGCSGRSQLGTVVNTVAISVQLLSTSMDRFFFFFF